MTTVWFISLRTDLGFMFCAWLCAQAEGKEEDSQDPCPKPPVPSSIPSQCLICTNTTEMQAGLPYVVSCALGPQLGTRTHSGSATYRLASCIATYSCQKQKPVHRNWVEWGSLWSCLGSPSSHFSNPSKAASPLQLTHPREWLPHFN
jgi:hypothetical protein